MAEVLLCSETFVKSVSSISDNVAGKYIQPSIREAQEIGLKSIVGSCLLEHLKNLFAEGQLADQYKDLVDRAQYFLAYTAIVELTMKVSFKVGNDYGQDEDVAFIDAILEKDQSIIISSYSEAVKNLEVTLAANESMDNNGKVITLNQNCCCCAKAAAKKAPAKKAAKK